MGRIWRVRGRLAATGAVVVACLGIASGCADEADDEAAGAGVPVASGVVLDGPGGEPRSGVEVELFVHPTALGAGSGTAEAIRADRDSVDAQGRFTLDAPASELTQHAGADGRVQIEVKVVGGSPGTRTTVLIRKQPGTGVAEVLETTGLMLSDD